MCRWTDGLITLSLDEVREIPLEEVCTELNLGDELLTMVVLSLEGEIGGEMILTFDEQNGRQLAASLLRRSLDTTAEWSALEKSALTETGNILGCAYMNALTRLINHELVPSAPLLHSGLRSQRAATGAVGPGDDDRPGIDLPDRVSSCG